MGFHSIMNEALDLLLVDDELLGLFRRFRIVELICSRMLFSAGVNISVARIVVKSWRYAMLCVRNA